jgi:hypothetical protein
MTDDARPPTNESAPRKLPRAAAIAAGVGAASALTAALGGRTPAAHAAPRPFSPGFADVVYGRLRRVQVDPPEIDIAAADGVHTVSFSAGALFWREGSAGLAAFQPGEEVLVEGTKSDGSFVAYALINLYRGLEAHILGHDGRRLTTDHGRVRLVDATRFQHDGDVTAVPTARIAVGSEVDVLGRLDPDAGDLVALRLYEVPGGHP